MMADAAFNSALVIPAILTRKPMDLMVGLNASVTINTVAINH